LIAEKIIPPMALAMPSDGLWGDGSAYLRHRGGDFERYIVDEIPALVRQIEPRIGNTLFITGLSMGGFGALRLGAKHANIFSGISAHSAITHFSQMLRLVEEPPEAFGSIDEDEASALHWLDKNRSVLPPIRFDCGTSDNLLPENRKLHTDLQARKIEHIYQEFPGGHEWSYWETHLADSLRFFGGCLNRSNP